MAMLDVQNLSFTYEGGDTPVFDNVSFRLDTDWKLGFTGRNGRGKTTFLRLLTGELKGRGVISSPVAFTYFPFAVPSDALCARDIARRMLPPEDEWRFARETELLGLPQDALERPFATLSNGERTKALLAVMFSQPERFMLIDEPTNHLDMEGRRLVSAYLAQKHGFILVSHDRVFLDGCIDHILSINRKNIDIQKGNYSTWQMNKRLQDEYERAQNERLKGEISRLGESMRRTAGWSDKVEKTKMGARNSGVKPDKGYIGAKSAKLMKRAKVTQARREDMLEEKQGLLKNIDIADELRMRPLAHHAQILSRFEDVTVRYDARTVTSGVSFTVSQGERVALAGRNGCGKSSLIKLLLSQDIPHTGRVTTASGLVVSYVPQDASALRGGMEAFIDGCGVDKTLFLTILRKMDFSRAHFEMDMASFSAGQKKKALLARSLCQQAHLYVWDEPLNYIDVLSREQIEQLILRSAPTLLFVEHDEAFCRNIATKTIRL